MAASNFHERFKGGIYVQDPAEGLIIQGFIASVRRQLGLG